MCFYIYKNYLESQTSLSGIGFHCWTGICLESAGMQISLYVYSEEGGEVPNDNLNEGKRKQQHHPIYCQCLNHRPPHLLGSVRPSTTTRLAASVSALFTSQGNAKNTLHFGEIYSSSMQTKRYQICSFYQDKTKKTSFTAQTF